MELQVQVNQYTLNNLRRKLEQTHGAIGITTQWLVWDTARLAAKDAVKYSAPWANGVPGTSKAQLNQGQSAVNNDIERIFATKDDSKYIFFTNKGNGKKYAKNKKTGLLFEIDPSLFDSDIKSLHLSKRNVRGRVARQSRQAWVDGKKLQDYIKSVQARVGSLKAAWLPAEEYFSRKVNAAVRAPAWIIRQIKSGSFLDAIGTSGNGSAVLINQAPHNSAIRRDMISFIQNQRQKFIRNMSEKRMQQIADQFNRSPSVKPIKQAAVAA